MAKNPPPLQKPRFDGTKKKAALEIVAARGFNRGALATALGTSLRTLDRHMADDPTFRAGVDSAKLEFLASLVEAARTRAVDGVEEITKGPGGTTVTRRRYSDALLTLLLKSKHGLGQFVDKVEIDQTVQGHIEHTGALHPSELTTEQQRAARILLQRN